MTMREHHNKWNEAWEEGFYSGLTEARHMIIDTLSQGKDRSEIQIKLDRLIAKGKEERNGEGN